MNRFLLILLSSILLFQCAAYKPNRSRQKQIYHELKIGAFNPVDTGTGTTVGYSLGQALDDRLFLAAEFNFFQANFQKATNVAEFDDGGITFSEKQLELNFSTQILSTYLMTVYQAPLGGRSSVFIRASFGGGFDFASNREENFIENVDRTRRFTGLTAQGTGGIGLQISETAKIFVDVVYRNGELTKTGEPTTEGLPTFRILGVSGLGVRGGINFVF